MKKILVVDDSPSWVKHHISNIKTILNNNIEIFSAYSAKEADNILSANIDKPFDIIFTDMQMETNFLPLYAGEWFIKQIQFYPEYKNTKIVIISATYNIAQIASKYGVGFIPKKECQIKTPYKEILEFIQNDIQS